MMHAFNASTREAEAGQPGLQIKFQDNQSYTENFILKQTGKQKLTTTANEQPAQVTQSRRLHIPVLYVCCPTDPVR